MRRYYLQYLVFWLPALAVSLFFHNSTTLSQVLQWFFAFFMVFGFAVTTGMAAYRFPRGTLSTLLIYTGVAVLSISVKYGNPYGSTAHTLANRVGGALSFRPLDVLVVALLDFNIRQEYYVVGALVVICLIGYLAGLAYRRIRPNPYRPQIRRS